MFLQNAFLLFSDVVKDKQSCGNSFIFETLLTRKRRGGLVLKHAQRGNITEIKTNKHSANLHLILACSQKTFGTEVRCAGRVDDILAERIVMYMRDYYEKRHTNCSTFVEFIRTGNFRECDFERESFMFSGGMKFYTGQKIRTGDSVCIFYYNKLGGSRKAPVEIRKHWQKAGRNVTGDLTKLKAAKDRLWSSEQILSLYRELNILYTDYHFMICVGVHDGKPIFIHQLGRNDPAEENNMMAPIVASIGMTDMMGYKRPALMFIKRGRM
jgi:hypothetical protein